MIFCRRRTMPISFFLKKSNHWIFISLMLIAFCGCDSHQEAPLKQEEIITIAKRDLPSKGELHQGPDGYVYLKVTNQYIDHLFPLIKEPGFNPPLAYRRHSKVGAHISVFYKDEARRIGKIKEIGKVYSFEPERIKHVRSGRKEYVVLEVKAPDLENLRRHYGFPPKVMHHEFHITLAEKQLKP